jgi:uncharacterized protein (DUF1330 family)
MVYLTQLVYVREGREATFQEFEAIVLPLLAKYGGELLLRLRPDAASKIEGSQDVPYEVHVVRFANEDDFFRCVNDEERQRVLHLKDESVSVSLLIKGTSV